MWSGSLLWVHEGVHLRVAPFGLEHFSAINLMCVMEQEAGTDLVDLYPIAIIDAFQALYLSNLEFLP